MPLKRYTVVIPMILWGIVMFVVGFKIGDRVTVNNKEITEPTEPTESTESTESTEIIPNNPLCSYCGKDKWVAMDFPNDNIRICQDCLILTFDLMLGRGE